MAKRKSSVVSIETITLTPEMAADLLEHNALNRPLSDAHVRRIANQIISGKWRFNGDTIKVATNDNVLDGQHRLWAVIEAKKPISTIVVYGVDPEAFSTIDTLRKPRSGGDVVALAGQVRHRNIISSALAWQLRWQRGVLTEYLQPANRIENSDIHEAFEAHKGMVRAVERTSTLVGLANRPIMAFLYYVLANRDEALAERMINTLDDPAGVATMDPFFKLRVFFTTNHHRHKDPLEVIALAIKAINAAHRGDKINTLSWKSQGARAEEFPVLKV